MRDLQDFDEAEFGVLADIRHTLRRFQLFSEEAAMELGLQPQQHQLLLQVAGAAAGVETSVLYVAERMGLRHNSAVELSKRCEQAGLIARKRREPDRRSVILTLTPDGRKVLKALSIAHAKELREMAPELIQRLGKLNRDGLKKKRSES